MANILHEGRVLERYSSHKSNFCLELLPLSRATAMAERSRVPVSRLFNNARGFEPHLGRKFKRR